MGLLKVFYRGLGVEIDLFWRRVGGRHSGSGKALYIIPQDCVGIEARGRCRDYVRVYRQ